MKARRLFGWTALAVFSSCLALSQSAGTALVRHAPAVNGRVEGSVQVMAGENIALNGNAVVTGDLLVPGTPAVELSGNPAYGGTQDGAGTATPSDYSVTLSGRASLAHVVRRTDPVALPAVPAPPAPAGARSVSINSSSESPGNFATLRDLTLGGSAGQIAVPPGAYGAFTANGGNGFILGVADATEPVFIISKTFDCEGRSARMCRTMNRSPPTIDVGGDLGGLGLDRGHPSSTSGQAGRCEARDVRRRTGSSESTRVGS